MDGLGSASPPVAPTATTGEGRHPCTWPRTFWFKPLSAFGLLDLTTFISSSPELAMPSTLAPNRLSASSRRALSREARPPWVGEVTLSQELRTARSPRPHVLVGYQWSHTGLRPGRKTSHNRYIRSFVSHPPQIRTCTSMHPVPHLRTSLRRSKSPWGQTEFQVNLKLGLTSHACIQSPGHNQDGPSNHAPTRSVCTAAAVAPLRARFSHSCGINVSLASLGRCARTCE